MQKKVRMTNLCLIAVLVLAVLSFAACVETLVESIEINRLGIPTRVYVGDSVDFSALVVSARMSDGKLVELDADQYELDLGDFTTEQSGNYVITVKYESKGVKFEERFNIQVIEKMTTDEGSYFMDGDVMVIFAGFEYTFEGISDLVVKQGENTYPVDGDILKIDETGEYVLVYKNSSGETVNRDIRVIDRLVYFAEGESRTIYKSTIAEMAQGGTEFINKEAAPYFVGTSNEFYFDLSLESTQTDKVIYPTTDIVDYKFEVMTDGDYYEKDLEEVAEVKDGYKFLFKKELIGKLVRVTITAKYGQDAIEGGYHDFKPVTMEFQLNDGYNVFTHKELQKWFGSLYVHTINIHRNITTYFEENQLNPDGTPKNIEPYAMTKYIEYDEEGTLIANNTASSYVRVSYNIADDHLTVNGNYFTVDGSQLIVITPDDDNLYPDQPGSLTIAGVASDVCNSQSSMFFAEVHSSTLDSYLDSFSIEDAPLLTDETLNEHDSSLIIYNNLTVIGNTEVPRGDMTQEEIYEAVIKKSGSYAGLRADSVDMNVNNCVIKFTCIGVFATGCGTDVSVNQTYVTESWANNIYGNNFNLTLTESYLYAAGGSGIWLEDTNYREGSVFDPNIVVDDASVVENFVSGTEAWFSTNGMSAFVAGAKSQLDGIVNQYSAGRKTMVKTETDSEGVPYEVFNFAYVVVLNYTKQPDQVINILPYFQAGEIKIQRNPQLLNSDPRNVSGVGFLAPLGLYSDTMTFVNAATEKGTEIFAEVQAGNQEVLAALTAFMEANGISDMQEGITQYAGFLVMNASFLEEGVKFLEIHTETPVGSIIAYTEIFDIEN